MLQSTFVLLKGIGEYTERRLWEAGIGDWSAFLARPSLPGVSPERKRGYDEHLLAARERLDSGDARYFSRCLRTRDHWRLYPTFRPRAAYLDIETTGGPPDAGEITVVGLYAQGRMTTLVRGESLTGDRLAVELGRHDLLVTFFGSVFDLPYLRAKFPGLPLSHAHVDLCFAARRLGLRGGLKQIERTVGIPRPEDLAGLDGWEAVRLWHAWERGDAPSLDRLLRYNEADARNLEPLAEAICERLLARYRPPIPGADAPGRRAHGSTGP